MREMKREWGSPCYFVMHQPDVVLRELRFDWKRDWVWWVSVWKSADGDMREMKREWGSPCYFVMHQPDVVLLCLRFDSKRDLVWWVSVWKSADGDMREMKREWGSPCYFVMHQPDVVLQELRFDCCVHLWETLNGVWKKITLWWDGQTNRNSICREIALKSRQW